MLELKFKDLNKQGKKAVKKIALDGIANVGLDTIINATQALGIDNPIRTKSISLKDQISYGSIEFTDCLDNIQKQCTLLLNESDTSKDLADAIQAKKDAIANAGVLTQGRKIELNGAKSAIMQTNDASKIMALEEKIKVINKELKKVDKVKNSLRRDYQEKYYKEYNLGLDDLLD